MPEVTLSIFGTPAVVQFIDHIPNVRSRLMNEITAADIEVSFNQRGVLVRPVAPHSVTCRCLMFSSLDHQVLAAIAIQVRNILREECRKVLDPKIKVEVVFEEVRSYRLTLPRDSDD